MQATGVQKLRWRPSICLKVKVISDILYSWHAAIVIKYLLAPQNAVGIAQNIK